MAMSRFLTALTRRELSSMVALRSDLEIATKRHKSVKNFLSLLCFFVAILLFLKLESPVALALLIVIHSRSVNHRQPQIRSRSRTLFTFNVFVAPDRSATP